MSRAGSCVETEIQVVVAGAGGREWRGVTATWHEISCVRGDDYVRELYGGDYCAAM